MFLHELAHVLHVNYELPEKYMLQRAHMVYDPQPKDWWVQNLFWLGPREGKIPYWTWREQWSTMRATLGWWPVLLPQGQRGKCDPSCVTVPHPTIPGKRIRTVAY
jgi:hypothetical protein